MTLRRSYVGWDDGCEEVTTYYPTLIITVRSGVAEKTVEYYQGCEGLPVLDQIDGFARAIDDVAGTSRWIGVR